MKERSAIKTGGGKEKIERRKKNKNKKKTKSDYQWQRGLIKRCRPTVVRIVFGNSRLREYYLI